MKIHRFIGPIDISKAKIEIRDQELVHQINRVLKLRVGEQIIFGDGKGSEALSVLETVSKSLIEAKVISHTQNENELQKQSPSTLLFSRKTISSSRSRKRSK
jgi:16S rRNA U1498 N3-methylase RsmE